MRAIKLPSVSADAINRIEATLPEYFPRTSVAEVTNGLFTAAFIETEMHRGRGPAGHQIGKKCVLFRDEFVEWMRNRYLGDDYGDISRTSAVSEGHESTSNGDGKASEEYEGDRG